MFNSFAFNAVSFNGSRRKVVSAYVGKILGRRLVLGGKPGRHLVLQ